MYESVNITAVFTWTSGDLDHKVIPHPHPFPHFLFCSWWGDVHGKEVRFWCNFLFKARVVELCGIVPIAKLPKDLIPCSSQVLQVVVLILLNSWRHWKNHCFALWQGAAYHSCQYLTYVCEAVAADTDFSCFSYKYVLNTTFFSGSFCTLKRIPIYMPRRSVFAPCTEGDKV